ncbi:hypothetical protein HH214_11715 [Mucilaginibacter robiniae]|uniref:Alpha/beta hydrolase n=1 Tax=Mucilaginibacter robiniae TaxID=2728022 RepID=A0A7L5E474_9SPHI|nr:alpha/beta fold hydrolase [Mucilaginibacter robiniae]QJD96494.1 hypothetical protein HH214_11715 [Mucilaginibacter robiniae]
MKHLHCTILLLVLGFTRLHAQLSELQPKLTVTLHATASNTDYSIYLQLPQSYGKLNSHYPVILLFDAQDPTLFNYTSSTVDRLMYTNDIPNAILVGIVQNDRSKELGVERNDTTAKQFLNFVKNDLIAYLHSHYRINDYFTFIGHSLGGQFVTYALTVEPKVFRSVISISGALNYPSEYTFYQRKVLTALQNYVSVPHINLAKQKYYFSVGNEGFQDSGFKIGALTADSLLKQYPTPCLNWHFDKMRGFNHMTMPLVSIPAGLTFIYHDWHFADSLAMDVLLMHQTDPIVALQKQKEKIINDYGVDIALPYSVYYQFAKMCLSTNKILQAKQLAEMIINLYPNDDESYALMADVLHKQGNIKGAIQYLQLAQANSSIAKYQEKITQLQRN